MASERRAPAPHAAAQRSAAYRAVAYYTDGLTAVRHAVTVQAGQGAIYLQREDGVPTEPWPYAGLYALEEAYGDAPLRLGNRARGDATLTLLDPALVRQIEARSGRRLRGRAWLRPRLALGLVAGAASVLLVLAGLAWGPGLLAPLARWVPPAWEQALGQRVVEQLSGGAESCDATAGRAALTALTERLTAAAKLPYRAQVHAVRRSAANAFAAPGGNVVVLAGLLEEAPTPEAFAGVLAHELAHVQARHPMRGLIRGASTTLIVRALLGDTGTLDETAGRFAQQLVLSAYSREDEAAADAGAIALLNAANISGSGLAAFLRRMEAKRRAEVPQWLGSHPATAERIATIEADARGSGSAMNDAAWAALRAICR